jgi:hypothetical protein
MSALRFEEPVCLITGIGVPVEVDSVERAYALLDDWPIWRRNSAHAVALNVCRAALSGDVAVETARATLAAFARRSNILVDDPSPDALPTAYRPTANVVELHP